MSAPSPTHLVLATQDGCQLLPSPSAQLDAHVDFLLNGARPAPDFCNRRTEVWYDAALNCKVFARYWRVQLPLNLHAKALYNIDVKGPIVLAGL